MGESVDYFLEPNTALGVYFGTAGQKLVSVNNMNSTFPLENGAKRCFLSSADHAGKGDAFPYVMEFAMSNSYASSWWEPKGVNKTFDKLGCTYQVEFVSFLDLPCCSALRSNIFCVFW
jgi:hypothetical protein